MKNNLRILIITLIILFGAAFILIKIVGSKPPDFDIYKNNASGFEEPNQSLKL